MATVTTATGQHTVPPCPSWCTLPADHDLDTETAREWDGAIVRVHDASRRVVAGRAGEVLVVVYGSQTVGRDDDLDEVALFVHGDCELSPDAARQFAAELVAGAELLEKIQGGTW